jgi:hypothetical protein
MAYYLGRDVSVYIRSEDDVGALPAGTPSYNDGATGYIAFSDKGSNTNTGIQVTDLTGVDLGIGVTDEDITYIGSKTVLKAEIKKETTIALTRKKSNNVWDVVFNNVRWGMTTTADTPVANAAGEPTTTSSSSGTGTTFGYEIKVILASAESITVPNMQITGHTVTLNADGTTEETLELVSYENPTVAA